MILPHFLLTTLKLLAIVRYYRFCSLIQFDLNATSAAFLAKTDSESDHSFADFGLWRVQILDSFDRCQALEDLLDTLLWGSRDGPSNTR